MQEWQSRCAVRVNGTTLLPPMQEGSGVTELIELTDAELDHIAGGERLEGGQAVAETNHNSGHGPGYFLQQDTAEAVAKVQKRK